MSTSTSPSSVQGLTPAAALMLTIAPVLWAGNAVIGRLAHEWISPFALNLLRWVLAFVLLLPLVWRTSGWLTHVRSYWRYYAMLGLLGFGCYNSMLYLALKTSTPLNLTLVGSSIPVWMLAFGRIFWGIPVTRRQMLGAVLSIIGVAVVLSRGELTTLSQVQWVIGDFIVLAATMIWAVYTWLLTRYDGPPQMRSHWAAFLAAQMGFGILWSLLFTGAEVIGGEAYVHWGWPLAAILAYVSIGPAILAYRFWGAGVQRAGAAIAGFFGNLIPLFTALLSVIVLGDVPQLYHGAAFVLIVGGIVISAKR